MTTLTDLLTAFWVSFLASAVAAPLVMAALRAGRARQTIDPHAPETHQKKQGTPTMGGLIVLVGLVAWGFAFPGHWMLLAWLGGFAALGFVDDFVMPKLTGKRGLGWLPKLGAQVALAACTPALMGLPNTPRNLILAGLGVLFFANAYNFADGLDALAGSIGLIHFLAFGALGVLWLDWAGAPALPVHIAGAVAGGLVAFLFVNAPPARVFMGDTGSMPIGALMGFLTVGWFAETHIGRLELGRPTLPLLVLSLLMVIELVPVPMQVGWFKLTRKRLFPMAPIHHAFEKKGWPESRVVWSFALVQVLLAVAALALAVRDMGGLP